MTPFCRNFAKDFIDRNQRCANHSMTKMLQCRLVSEGALWTKVADLHRLLERKAPRPLVRAGRLDKLVAAIAALRHAPQSIH